MPIGEHGRPIIPFRLRIGVTGHRQLGTEIDWRNRIATAVSEIKATLPQNTRTPVLLTAVSPLAEGADRLVAAYVLEQRGGRLEVPLPLPIKEYEKDFATKESRDNFNGFLDSASVVMRAPRFATREEAYEWAGQTTVANCDVVIAVWDGHRSSGRGGTAEIVDFALRHGRPVVQISTGTDGKVQILKPEAANPREMKGRQLRWYLRPLGFRINWGSAPKPIRDLRSELDKRLLGKLHGLEDAALPPRGLAALSASLRDLELHNSPVDDANLRTAEGIARHEFMTGGSTPSTVPERERSEQIWTPIADWLLPHYARADYLAIRAQTKFRYFFWFIYLLPVGAIATVAIQIEFYPTRSGLLWIEALLLFIALFLLWKERQRGWHRLWIENRHLAERCRCAFFLAAVDKPGRGRLVDGPDRAGGELIRDPGGQSSDDTRIRGFHESASSWLQRAFTEIWQSRPHCYAAEDDVQLLRTVFASSWIRGQIAYHDNAASFHGAAYRSLKRTIQFLFAATVVIAAIHAVGFWSSADPTLYGMAITLPALAGALLAVQRQREYRRNQERSAEISVRLINAEKIISEATTLAELRREASSVEDLIMDENRDWYGLMRMRVLELPT